jgi:hypothetical protein
MKFDMLTESEMIQKAKDGNRAYLDLLLSKHEQFLLQYISNTITNPKELLTLRHNCVEYVHSHFHDKFNPHQHTNFAEWLQECVFSATQSVK